MKRVLAILIVTGLLGGCSGHHVDRYAPESEQPVADRLPPAPQAMPPAMAVAAVPRPRSLIFDRVPGRYSASDFAWRSDWPSANSYYRAPEFVYYREHFHDIQGPGFNSFNQSYRHFDAYRYGTGVR